MPTITTKHKGDMLFETSVGDHTIITDVMPTPEWGGQNRAPTPPEYFVSSLGTCVAAFVARYCKQSGIDASDMGVEVSFDKAAQPVRLENFRILVRLPHADCGERKTAMKRVAENCVLHETLAALGASRIGVEIIDKTG